MKQNTFCLLLFVCCIALSTSCNKVDEEGRKNISGTITLNGEVLEGGSIQFSPLDIQAKEGAGVIGGTTTIKDGKYELKKDLGLFSGKYSVRITYIVVINPKTGLPFKLPLEDPEDYEKNINTYKTESLIPDKYNTKTTLEITVGEDKNQTHDFELTK